MTDAITELIARAISDADDPMEDDYDLSPVYFQKIATAALKALDAAGYAVAPKEPTTRMLSAGGFHCITGAEPVSEPDKRQALSVYRAMLAEAAREAGMHK